MCADLSESEQEGSHVWPVIPGPGWVKGQVILRWSKHTDEKRVVPCSQALSGTEFWTDDSVSFSEAGKHQLFTFKSPNRLRIEDSVMAPWLRTFVLIRITHRQMSGNHCNVSGCSTGRTQSSLKWVVNLLLALLFFICFRSEYVDSGALAKAAGIWMFNGSSLPATLPHYWYWSSSFIKRLVAPRGEVGDCLLIHVLCQALGKMSIPSPS